MIPGGYNMARRGMFPESRGCSMRAAGTEVPNVYPQSVQSAERWAQQNSPEGSQGLFADTVGGFENQPNTTKPLQHHRLTIS